jgi:hypothetical protein
MTTSLFKSIHTVIFQYIDIYTTLINKEHGIDKENLIKLWKQVELNPPTISIDKNITNSSVAPKKIVSVYVQFCNKHRSILKQKNPNMSFGDISKELGKMWRSLSQQEKDNYQISSKPQKIEVIEEQKEDYSKLSFTELKQICEERNLKKSGNKTILISRIQENDTERKTNITPPPIHVEEEELVFFENESPKTSNISSTSSTSSFIIDEDDDFNFSDIAD